MKTWFLILCFLVCGGMCLRAADPAADQAFNAAAKAFQDESYDRAEKELAAFAQRFPASEHLPQAVLLQARARFHLAQFNGVVELLTSRLNVATNLADQYRFWMAQAHFQRGDFSTAANGYEQLLKDFPQSALRLEAVYGQALAHFRSRDPARTVAVLSDPAGPFQQAAQSTTNATLLAHGYLLLGEALLAQREYRKAEEIVRQLATRKPPPELDWQRQFLLARIELADQRTDAAFQVTTNLIVLAATNAVLQTQALMLQAEILRQNQPVAAIQAYERILQLAGVSAEARRQAFTKMIELLSNQNEFAQAIQRLSAFITQNPQDPALDLFRLTLGELNLKRFYWLMAHPPATNLEARVTQLTNILQQAQSQFDLILTTQTNSPLVGKAYLDRGWCFWESAVGGWQPARFADAQREFQTACERLPRSEDQAIARFKLADCQFQLKTFPAALTNYQFVLDQYGDLPKAKQTYFDQALHQIVRANLDLGRVPEARTAVTRLIESYPKSALSERALFYFAEKLNGLGQPADARSALTNFVTHFPQSQLLPDVHLAMARTYARETNWTAAIAQCESWLTRFTTNSARSQVEFDRAWMHYQAGQESNAFLLFTNFVAHYPTNYLAPLAQFWVGDHHMRRGDPYQAEMSYKHPVFAQVTNAAYPGLGYQAVLAAAMAAFKREGYGDAKSYLTNLLNDGGFPERLFPDAYFLLGNVFIEERAPGDTNLNNFQLALEPFNRITNRYPQHRLAPLAYGRIGDCQLQIAQATKDPKRYDEATNAYQKVIDSPLADVAARSQAEVGLGIVLEKKAALPGLPAAERAALLDAALNHYQNVIYEKGLKPNSGEQADAFWVKEAGQTAGRLLTELQRPAEAANLYRRLKAKVPALSEIWDRRLDQLRQQLNNH